MSQKEVGQNSIKTLFSAGATQVSLGETVDAFCKAEMAGKSEKTKCWYLKMLAGMLDYFGEDRLLADLMESDLIQWKASLYERHVLYPDGQNRPPQEGSLSPYTIHGFLRAAKRLFRWLHKKGVLAENIAREIDLPKLPKTSRAGISDANVKAMLEAARDNPRDYALFCFVEATGARLGGIAALRLSDLNLDSSDCRIRRRVTLHEKGNKTRTVPMTKKALRALKDWLEVRPDVDDDQVFLGKSPGQDWRPLTPRGISGIFKRYKYRLALPGNCSPHQWRHRWARRRLQEGMDLSQVSQLLGHEDVAITVRYYGQFSIDQLQEAYDRYVTDPED